MDSPNAQGEKITSDYWEHLCEFHPADIRHAKVRVYRQRGTVAPVIVSIEGLKPDDVLDQDIEIELTAEHLRKILGLEGK